jgi:hypothetical protein
MVHLSRRNQPSRRLIDQVREAAVLLRKPAMRDALGVACPAHCATRWIDDYPILRFIIDHRDVALDLLGAAAFELDPEFVNLLPLLEKVFLAVRSLEADDASLSGVYVHIEALLRSLNRSAASMECKSTQDFYVESISIIKQLTLDTTNFVFQLAHVLTPSGRIQARDEILRIQTRKESSEDSDDDHLGHSGFVNKTDNSGTSSDEEDILGAEFARDLPAVARLAGAYPSTHAPFADGSPADEPPTGEPRDRGESDELEGEENGDQDLPSDDGVVLSDDTLCAQAEAGLRDILAQWGIDEDLIGRTLGTFQGYVTSAPADLRMRPIPDTNRYPWSIQSGSGPHWAVLSDIAIRLEALVCNEAVSERTNGAMRRLLAPFRMKMKRQVLLSRLTLAKHGTIETGKGRD